MPVAGLAVPLVHEARQDHVLHPVAEQPVEVVHVETLEPVAVVRARRASARHGTRAELREVRHAPGRRVKLPARDGQPEAEGLESDPRCPAARGARPTPSRAPAYPAARAAGDTAATRASPGATSNTAAPASATAGHGPGTSRPRSASQPTARTTTIAASSVRLGSNGIT